MHLPEYQLFLGFAVGSCFQKALQGINPHLREMFIDNKEYLKEVRNEEIVYLGKVVGSTVDLSKVLLMEANIYSLLTKLVPSYSCHEQQLHIFPIEK